MAIAEITLLGAPRVEHGGVPVEADTRKATALVAYLAVTGRRHTRDALAGLLWPEYNQARSRAALRRTLSSLRGAREAGWLRVDREGVDLSRDGVVVDVDRFRDLLAGCRNHGHPGAEVCARCLPLLSEAAALYGGDFMAGFGLRDSVAFDDWQFFEAEGLRRELAGALERLALGLAARGEWEAAIVHARRWLSLDHLHEPAHRLLLALYAWSGQRAAALRQYRECVRVLGKELGVAPLEETTALHRAVQENAPPPPPVLAGTSTTPRGDEAGPSPVEASAPPSEGPLVGRGREWDKLLQVYGEISAEGRVVVIEGEGGIGKTRLAGEFVARAGGEGAAVVAARCYAGETNLAYGPFVEGLSAALGREGFARLEGLPAGLLGEAARLLPGLEGLLPEGRDLPALDTPGARSRFYEGVIQVLLALLDGPRPGVLFLDDLQWADEASLDLLTYLVRRLEGRPLLVLVTWRAEDVPESHRLRGLLAEARRSGAATVLRLGRLDSDSVGELVAHALGGAEDPETLASRLGGETEGLPLFLTEYLTAVAAGELDPGEAEWALPGGVQDLLRGRLRTVGETAGQVLAAAAVVGRSFDFDTVREASGRAEEETLVSLEELVSRGLIREEKGSPADGPTYDFDHDKLRVLVYEETGPARRRLLHRRAAAALAGRGRGREVGPLAGQIARHHRLAGQEAEASEYHKLAGDHARGLYANGDALAHYEEALALGHPEVAALHEAVGDLRTRRGEYGAALASYELAAASGEATPALEHKIGNVHARRGDRDLAGIYYRSAQELLRGDEGAAPGELARLYSDLSLLSHQQNDPEEARSFAQKALGLAEDARDTRALAQAHNMLGILAGGEAAIHHLRESLNLAEALGDPESRVAALNNLALVLGSRGQTDEALEISRTALELCARLGDRHREAAIHNNLADLLHAAGREEESMAHLKKAVATFAKVGERGEMRPEIWKLVEW